MIHPEGDAPRVDGERWARSLFTLSMMRTVLTDPGAGFDMPTIDDAADAIDYAIECIELDVDAETLEAFKQRLADGE